RGDADDRQRGEEQAHDVHAISISIFDGIDKQYGLSGLRIKGFSASPAVPPERYAPSEHGHTGIRGSLPST
ncbi:hypothetical protein, partial [Streptomyces turgidiscabies]|uniref:hypothetical protein n=1 Tax=Streptomyces turgidiscabies TaxID=85558 RepID=UPI0038F5F8C4